MRSLLAMKATTFLQNQHRDVRQLFQTLESGKGDIRACVEQLADALVAHTAIEQQIFYPAVKEVDEDLVLESFEEHATMELELKRLLATDLSDPSFKAKVVVLKELVLHHVKEEEDELFPECEKALGKDKLESLGREMKTMYEEAIQEGHEATLPKTAPTTTADEARIRTWARPAEAGRASAASLA